MTTQLTDNQPAMTADQRSGWRPRNSRPQVEELLAVLAHEMRNPLGALSNALEVLPDAQADPSLLRDLLDLMRRQVRQLSCLSDDLLDVTRIKQGTFELHLQQVELQQLVTHACEQVRPYVEQRGHLQSVKMPAEPLVLYGDASRLLQVFANLIQNAAKFTDRAGKLDVVVGTEAHLAVVRVADNGAGIEAYMLSAIFGAFTQVGGREAASGGLGIGLQLVKTIVELHGGTVNADSEGPGRGSTFTVRLPLFVQRTAHANGSCRG